MQRYHKAWRGDGTDEKGHEFKAGRRQLRRKKNYKRTLCGRTDGAKSEGGGLRLRGGGKKEATSYLIVDETKARGRVRFLMGQI